MKKIENNKTKKKREKKNLRNLRKEKGKKTIDAEMMREEDKKMKESESETEIVASKESKKSKTIGEEETMKEETTEEILNLHTTTITILSIIRETIATMTDVTTIDVVVFTAADPNPTEMKKVDTEKTEEWVIFLRRWLTEMMKQENFQKFLHGLKICCVRHGLKKLRCGLKIMLNLRRKPKHLLNQSRKWKTRKDLRNL